MPTLEDPRVSDATTTHDIMRFRNKTKPIVIELNNDDGDLDITSWAFLLAVNKKPRPVPPSSDLFTVAGTIEQAVAGGLDDPCEVKFSPTAANMNQEPGTYYYDVEQTDADSKTDVILKGKLIILQGINS